MAIANYPAWPFEPNWTSSMTEVIEWLTDVMVSPSGSEQRRSLRYFPRRTFEYTIAADGDERSLLDQLLTSFGAQRWYLPLWHEVNFLSASTTIGATVIPFEDADTSKMKAGGFAYLVDGDPFHNEIVEILSIGSDTITLTTPTTSAWPTGSRIHPASVAQLTDQPAMAKRSDRLVTSEVRFRVLDANLVEPGASLTLDQYRGFFVISTPPDDRVPLNSGYERMLIELDNMTSIPQQADSAGRPFSLQQHSWVIEGRVEHLQFDALMQLLRGRAIPIWMPTFMEDFVLAAPVEDGDTAIVTKRSGFALAGGPRWDRQDIMIETLTGRLYRRIVDVAVDGNGNETVVLDQPIDADVSLASIVRICFMTLMRLNQDNIEIEHITDTEGVSTALVTFRSAPDTRVPLPAVFQ